MENKHAQAIPAEVLQEVESKIKEARKLLQPYEITFKPEERRDMLKMGAKTLEFVDKSHEYARNNPNLVPPFLNMEHFAVDYADAHGLWGVRNLALQLYEAIDDTEMGSGSEAYHAALIFYNSVKVAAKQDIAGAKAVYDELKARFPGGKRKSTGSEE
jgi:hypothetical protein